MSNASAEYTSGTTEFITAVVTADTDLGDQPVAISIDEQVTWLAAVWDGDPGKQRRARTTTPVHLTSDGTRRVVRVHVKVTQAPEIPVMHAGDLLIIP